jgi:hypothetical protein
MDSDSKAVKHFGGQFGLQTRQSLAAMMVIQTTTEQEARRASSVYNIFR